MFCRREVVLLGVVSVFAVLLTLAQCSEYSQIHKAKSQAHPAQKQKQQLLKEEGEQIMHHLQNNNQNSRVQRRKLSQFNSSNDSYVALCLIVKDENKFIREWINYHNYIGIGKFYVYDHNSSIPVLEDVQDYIESGLVDYTFLTSQWTTDSYGMNKINYIFNSIRQVNSPQRWVHTDCLLQNYQKHQFIGMIDIDEFIILNQGAENNFEPVPHPNLPAFLKDYEDYGGLLISWRIYGSSGLVESPQGGVLQNYIDCAQRPGMKYDLTDVKHLVNTKYVGDAFCVIHMCQTTKPSVDVLKREKKLSENKKFPTWEGINLNHYVVKSKADFEHKRVRGGGHSPKSSYLVWRDYNFLNKVDSMATDNCSFMKQVYLQCCSRQQQY